MSRFRRDVFLINFKPILYIIWPLRPYVPPSVYSLAGPRVVNGRASLTQEGVELDTELFDVLLLLAQTWPGDIPYVTPCLCL